MLADQLLVVQLVVRQNPDRCCWVDLGSVYLGILYRFRVVNNHKFLGVRSLADRDYLLRIGVSVDRVVNTLRLLESVLVLVQVFDWVQHRSPRKVESCLLVQ